MERSAQLRRLADADRSYLAAQLGGGAACELRWVSVPSERLVRLFVLGRVEAATRVEAQQRGGLQRGHVSESGRDNFGPGRQFQAHQGQREGVGVVGAGHYVRAAQVFA